MAANLLQSLSAKIESDYGIDYTAGWMYRNLAVAPIACFLYLVVIFSGKKWMAGRPPFDLRAALTVWNTMLAVFSTTGFLVMGPSLIQHIMDEGFIHTVCNSRINEVPLLSFVTFLFVFSKLLELGDTVFIVLRKTPLSFLHWYHHVTVLLYCWYGLGTRNAAGHWFISINLGVHSVMYSYYMFKAMGFRISPSIAKSITILQLLQFLVGLVLLFTGVWLKWGGQTCAMNEVHIKAGFVMYGSYFLLFMNFFYQRYIKPSPKKKKVM